MADWIYYNIFRFECLIKAIFYYQYYVLFEKPVISDISDLRDKDEIFRERLTDVLKNGRGTAAPRIVGTTIILLILTPWNLFCGIFQIQNRTVWFSGYIIASILAILVIVKADHPTKYLKDFKKAEFKSQTGLLRSIFAAVLTMIGIWSIFVITFIYSLRTQ